MIAMDTVKQIASMKAETLNRLSNWGRYNSINDMDDDMSVSGSGSGSYVLDKERLEFIKCDTMATKLAMSRARQTNADYQTTLMQVQLEVGIELAKILAHTIHPAFAATDAVIIQQEDGEVCGICQEDMVKGEEVRAMACCTHKFHDFCIFQWVQRKTNCPLCRSHMEETTTRN